VYYYYIQNLDESFVNDTDSEHYGKYNLDGFAYRQQTVLSLTALVKSNDKAKYRAANYDVTASSSGKLNKNSVLFKSDNMPMFQKIKLPQGSNTLELHAKGTGPAFNRISYQYNVLKKQSHPSFKVRFTVLFRNNASQTGIKSFCGIRG